MTALDVAALPGHRTANGIAYRTLGLGAPLVLIHGGSGSWLPWVRNIGPLAATRQVIALDLPGYGDSDDVIVGTTLDAYTDITRDAVLEACGAAQAIVIVAFSFGGLIGTGVAARLGSRLEKLALFAPSGFERPKGRVLGRRSRSHFPDGEAGERDYLRHNLLALMLADPASADDEAIAIQRWNLARTRFNNATDAFSYSNRLCDLLPAVCGPVLLAFGERDPTPYPSLAERIAVCREARPDLTLAIIPEAGHWAPFERPTATNDRIRRFLRGAPADPSVSATHAKEKP